MKKQLLSILMAVMMLLALCPAAALADDSLTLVEASFVPETDLPGSEELFSAYLEKQLGGGISLFSTGLRSAGSRLTGDAKALYDGLKPYMEKIAAGEITSTVISMGQQVGATVPMIEYEFTCQVDNTVTGPVFDALMLDMPYEMYWYEKTAKTVYSQYVSGNGNTLLVTFSFPVADAYQGADEYTLNTLPARVATAVANAKKVVSDNASKSDYEKLKAYKEYICGAVDYNHDAAADDYTGGFGDPWQLIHVFDGDASTKVVCEGYSKAFQYLCDMTAWKGDVQCYSVSGVMTGGTGAGAHMWNIVTVAGESYLVDVTNSDTGSVGQDGELFMGGTAGSIADGYTFKCGSQNVAFIYDPDTKSMWGTDSDSILKLMGENYDPSKEPVIETYTVTFVDGLGNKLSEQTVESGASATAPKNPTRDGYTFSGWDKAYTNITADVTVTAKWTVNQYTITFNTNGGSAVAAITKDYGAAVTAPAAPTREGYTFAGWDVEIPATMPAKDMTVTAKWTVNTYTVTFVDGNGKTLSTQTIEHGNAATAPAAPTWAGHTFTGWDKTFDNITADTIVTAKWDVNVYTVTFVDGNGKTLSTQTVEYGKAATAPAAPTWAGHTFTGWDKTFDNITADTTVTAKWDVNVYTVTFVDGNGKTLSTQTVEYGKAATAPAAPTWAGHTFTGWDKTFDNITADTTVTAKWDVNVYTVTFVDGQGKTLSEQKVESGKAATAPADPTRTGYTFTGWDKAFTTITADTTVTAQWKINTYTVTFVDGNGKTLSTQTVEHGKAATAPADPTWAGHTFTGWDKNFDNITADTTVTAKWDVNVYTVTFVDGQGNKLSEQKVESGKAATAPADPTRTGYTFTGWDKAFTNITADTTVTAQWKINTYTVTFVDGNGKTLSTQTVEYGKAAKAPADPTWAGHTFTGWDKGFDNITADTTVTAKWDVNVYTVTFVDGQGKTLSEQTVESGKAATAPADPTRTGYTFTGWDKAFTTITADTTVTAQWKINTYTVTFVDGNGKTLSTQTVEYGKAATAPADPTWAGHTFTGWDKAFDNITADTTVTAKWDVNAYTVTFVDGNGKTLSTQTVESGKAATAPADPTWAGHTFTGWDKNFDNITADTTVTAKWDVNVYTVTFVDGQGNKLSEQTVESGKAATAPADPTRTGYTFTGWDKAFTNITADTTVTAQWKINTYTVTFVDGNGKTLSTQNVEHGKAATAPADPTWAGHTFTGWDKTFDNITADTTVTAKWDEITYTVTVTNGNGSGKYTAGAAVTITAKAPEAGMMFTGWEGLEGLTITQGSAGTVSLTFTMPEKDVAVSAAFEKQAEEKFTVSFDGNGGTGSIANVEMTAGTFTLPACTLTAPEGKQFKAWCIDGVEYAAGSKVSVSANMTVEAVWENIPVQGSAPVITSPEKDQVVSVNEGETGKMSITAKDATTYQWYINRQDGKGYVTIKGAESASYTTSKVEAANDGFTYYCVAANEFGQVRSAVFTLEVVVEPEVPETGDAANLALWLAMLFTGVAGFLAMVSKARKAGSR